MTTLTYGGSLTTVTCWCGITHAVPDSLRSEQLRQFAEGTGPLGIYCPLGHSHVPVGESPHARHQRELARAEKRRKETLERLEAERRSHAATKGTLTKTRKRVGKGVCPCCKRHFVNVERHMTTQHPHYSDDE